MDLKNTNNYLGNAFLALGFLKAVLFVLVAIKLLSAFTNGTDIQTSYYELFTQFLGLLEILLFISSIVMIFINVKKETYVVKGYAYGLLAFIIEIITPGILKIGAFFFECILLIKAGNKIKEDNEHTKTRTKTSKQMIKSTNWFYADEKNDKTNKNSEQKINKYEKRLIRLEEEINAWKQLLNNGEINREIYEEEISKINIKQEILNEKIEKTSKML